MSLSRRSNGLRRGERHPPVKPWMCGHPVPILLVGSPFGLIHVDDVFRGQHPLLPASVSALRVLRRVFLAQGQSGSWGVLH
jgi:hypothetical protein